MKETGHKRNDNFLAKIYFDKLHPRQIRDFANREDSTAIWESVAEYVVEKYGDTPITLTCCIMYFQNVHVTRAIVEKCSAMWHTNRELLKKNKTLKAENERLKHRVAVLKEQEVNMARLGREGRL